VKKEKLFEQSEFFSFRIRYEYLTAENLRLDFCFFSAMEKKNIFFHE